MEILDTIEVWSLQIWVPIAIIFTLCLGVTIFKFAAEEDDETILAASIGSIIISVSLFIFACFGKFSYLNYKKLVIRIDENTTVAELYDKYDVIKKQDYSNIFYVKEKDNSK